MRMKHYSIRHFLILLLCLAAPVLQAQDSLDRLLPVRGFCVAAPSANRLDEFIRFIEKELAPRSVNTLVLRVDYNFQYASHPELKERAGLSKEDVGKLVAACKSHKIRVIPQINLLGHQSWQRTCGPLLRTYPEFDETPWVQFPERYTWPNPDRLYCKSYCPLHPKVHEVVFALMDELCDAFEADAFHAGMDEVFYIGEDKCPRCAGHDKAELFAGEVRLIREHLRQKGRELWIWGDRLLDGKTTGLGEWEASISGTDRAIDLIPRDVVICDWHYDHPAPTAIYFALKGLKVVTCPWNNPQVAVSQLQDVVRFRERASREPLPHLLRMMQTVWSGANQFLDRFNGKNPEQEQPSERTDAKCFTKLYEEIAALSKQPPASVTP